MWNDKVIRLSVTQNFTEIFKENNASAEDSSNDNQIDEDLQKNLTEDEYSFENATQKVLELIENDESFSNSMGDLTLKLTGLVNKIVDILNSTENFTAFSYYFFPKIFNVKHNTHLNITFLSS